MQLLSQSRNSSQPKVAFDECSDFKGFGEEVSLLTEHLSAALVNRSENDGPNLQV